MVTQDKIKRLHEAADMAYQQALRSNDPRLARLRQVLYEVEALLDAGYGG